MSEFRFELKTFEELSKIELYDALHLRDIVFVVGQKITSEPEIDGRDPECSHALLYRGDKLVAAARVFHQDDPMAVGRIAVLTTLQGQGIGTVLMRHIQDWIGERAAHMHAQAHLETWYGGLGWERSGEDFVEAEILHTPMRWRQGK